MNGFSPVDGFVEITEDVAEMIKYVANEPSVGLFYVQQHAQNAVPNLVSLNNKVTEKSRATTLHTEDLKDSLTMVRSMKECGPCIVSEMINDIKNSLVVMSTDRPKRGLDPEPTSGPKLGRASSWAPATWGHGAVHSPQEGEKTGSYLSTVFMSAKQRASNFKWAQLNPKESTQRKHEKPQPSDPPADVEAEELPVSSQFADEVQEPVPVDESLSNRKLLSESENYYVFRADKEAKLKEWLEGTGGMDSVATGDEQGA